MAELQLQEKMANELMKLGQVEFELTTCQTRLAQLRSEKSQIIAVITELQQKIYEKNNDSE